MRIFTLNIVPNKKGGEPLRIIETVAPYGTLSPVSKEVGDFQI